MLAVSWDTVRLFLHVLAATIWVGGQITLAALVPALRRFGADVTREAARRFNVRRLGGVRRPHRDRVWNIAVLSADDRHSSAYQATLMAKLVVVAISGVTAFLHARARKTVWMAVFGALTGLSALGALFLGVLLAG